MQSSDPGPAAPLSSSSESQAPSAAADIPGLGETKPKPRGFRLVHTWPKKDEEQTPAPDLADQRVAATPPRSQPLLPQVVQKLASPFPAAATNTPTISGLPQEAAAVAAAPPILAPPFPTVLRILAPTVPTQATNTPALVVPGFNPTLPALIVPLQSGYLSATAIACGDQSVRAVRRQTNVARKHAIQAKETAEQAARQARLEKHEEEVRSAKRQRTEYNMEMGFDHAPKGTGKLHNSAGVSKRGRLENLRRVQYQLGDFSLESHEEGMDWRSVGQEGVNQPYLGRNASTLTETMSEPAWTGNVGGSGVRGRKPTRNFSNRNRKNWQKRYKRDAELVAALEQEVAALEEKIGNGEEGDESDDDSDDEVPAKVERMEDLDSFDVL